MFVVMDQGCYQLNGPFNTEAEAQNWCDRANYHSPLKSEKWEFHIMEVFPPEKLGPIPSSVDRSGSEF